MEKTVHAINIANQFFHSNLHFIIIKKMILHQDIAIYFRGKRYLNCNFSYLKIIPFYFLIISAISALLHYINLNPYFLILVVNGSVGYILNILAPCIKIYKLGLIYVKWNTLDIFSLKIISFLTFAYIYGCLLFTSIFHSIIKFTEFTK